MKYRWMQKKDLKKINNKDFISLLKQTKTIANVVELDEEILGWVGYRIGKIIRIIKIAFKDENVFDFIIQNIRQKNKTIQIIVSEYDIKLQINLKKNGFIASGTKKIDQVDFYIFEG